jgi:hypothetical protein
VPLLNDLVVLVEVLLVREPLAVRLHLAAGCLLVIFLDRLEYGVAAVLLV